MKQFAIAIILFISTTAHAAGGDALACHARSQARANLTLDAAVNATTRASGKQPCGSSKEAATILARIILEAARSTDHEERLIYEQWIRIRFREYIDATIREGVFE